MLNFLYLFFFQLLNFLLECSVLLYGTLKLVLEGKKASGGHELEVDYWEVIGRAPPGGGDKLVNKDSHPDVQSDQRHMAIRGKTVKLI